MSTAEEAGKGMQRRRLAELKKFVARRSELEPPENDGEGWRTPNAGCQSPKSGNGNVVSQHTSGARKGAETCFDFGGARPRRNELSFADSCYAQLRAAERLGEADCFSSNDCGVRGDGGRRGAIITGTSGRLSFMPEENQSWTVDGAPENDGSARDNRDRALSVLPDGAQSACPDGGHSMCPPPGSRLGSQLGSRLGSRGAEKAIGQGRERGHLAESLADRLIRTRQEEAVRREEAAAAGRKANPSPRTPTGAMRTRGREVAGEAPSPRSAPIKQVDGSTSAAAVDLKKIEAAWLDISSDLKRVCEARPETRNRCGAAATPLSERLYADGLRPVEAASNLIHKSVKPSSPILLDEQALQGNAVTALNRNTLVTKWYREFNLNVFGNRLPKAPKFTWNDNLKTTAGLSRFYTFSGECEISSVDDRWSRPGSRDEEEEGPPPSRPGAEGSLKQIDMFYEVKEIELSVILLRDEYHLAKTLLHECCHVAQKVIDVDCQGKPHGPGFQKWAREATQVYPALRVESTHKYFSDGRKSPSASGYVLQRRHHAWECSRCKHVFRRIKANAIDPIVQKCDECAGGRLVYLGRQEPVPSGWAERPLGVTPHVQSSEESGDSASGPLMSSRSPLLPTARPRAAGIVVDDEDEGLADPIARALSEGREAARRRALHSSGRVDLGPAHGGEPRSLGDESSRQDSSDDSPDCDTTEPIAHGSNPLASRPPSLAPFPFALEAALGRGHAAPLSPPAGSDSSNSYNTAQDDNGSEAEGATVHAEECCEDQPAALTEPAPHPAAPPQRARLERQLSRPPDAPKPAARAGAGAGAGPGRSATLASAARNIAAVASTLASHQAPSAAARRHDEAARSGLSGEVAAAALGGGRKPAKGGAAMAAAGPSSTESTTVPPSQDRSLEVAVEIVATGGAEEGMLLSPSVCVEDTTMDSIPGSPTPACQRFPNTTSARPPMMGMVDAAKRLAETAASELPPATTDYQFIPARDYHSFKKANYTALKESTGWGRKELDSEISRAWSQFKSPSATRKAPIKGRK